jgi:ketosteroid isomerase-like protein
MTWYEDLYTSVDRKDMDAVAPWFAGDVVMTMGNSEPIVGRANVVGSLRQFQSTLAGLSHTFLAVIEQGDVAVLETSTRFELYSGASVELKGVTIIERAGGLITSQRMYVDMTPLWAAQDGGTAAAAPSDKGGLVGDQKRQRTRSQ